MKKCINCGQSLNTGNKFCSHKCRAEYAHKEYISAWKKGKKNGMKGKYQISTHIRKYLFEKHNNSCQKCGWNQINHYTGKVPLEVHHKDGNYLNNSEDNLELLCPNCHALTETFKSRGSGRPDRVKYYKKS